MKVTGMVTGIWGTKISIDRSKYVHGVREGSVQAGEEVVLDAESINGRLLATGEAVTLKKDDKQERHDSILVCVAAKIAVQTLDADSTDEQYEARADRVLAWIEQKVKS